MSGCLLGKPLEVLSFREGLPGLRGYLERADALPLRDYVPLLAGTLVEELGKPCCRGHIQRAEPDDDINYTLLALLILEDKGPDFQVADVARAWLNRLPAGTTWTAERAAYTTLLREMDAEFVNGSDAGFDLGVCSDNEFNEWIGAQIRADLYGWVCPGNPELAAKLASRDASLSHRSDGVYCSAFVAALGAVLPAAAGMREAVEAALDYIPADSRSASAVRTGLAACESDDPVVELHEHFGEMPPVHALNNLALVVWALCSADGDFGRAIGDVVSAGWDTDCNGATVGGLCGLAGFDIPAHWSAPWNGRIAFTLAGVDEIDLDEIVSRTVKVARRIRHANTLH